MYPQSSGASEQPTAAGEQVLARAVALARGGWGDRFIAAYALGSLAHGGFSPHVSDVDLGLVLTDPIDDADAMLVRELMRKVKTCEDPLSERLSVYWGSLATLSGSARGGRFPPLDLVDFKKFGRLLLGRDVRQGLRSPSLRELVVSSAEFALRHLSIPEVTARLRDPVALANAATKLLTKHVLYPVRFLFTARTGQVGMNDASVDYFSTFADRAAVELARGALKWRHEPPPPGDHMVIADLRAGVIPLYRMFLVDYEQRLREYDERELAQAYCEWRNRLDQPGSETTAAYGP